MSDLGANIQDLKMEKIADKQNTSEKEQEVQDLKNCPCGGGQSCIVARRSFGAFVYEDYVLTEAKVKLREHCFSEPTEEQNQAMIAYLDQNNNTNSVEIITK